MVIIGIFLNKFFWEVVIFVKKVYYYIKINENVVFVSYVVVEVVKKLYGLLDNKKIVLVGVGEMSEFVL